jgi:hypothetical protein
MLCPQTHFHGMYLGLRRYINQQQVNSSKHAYGPNENQSLSGCHLFENFAVLEMLCTSENGTVVSYIRDGQKIIACREISEEENQAYEDYVMDFQKGVGIAVQSWRQYLEAYVVDSSEMRTLAIKIWDALCRTPEKSLASVFINSPQQDVFGFGDLFMKNREPSLTTIFLSPFYRQRRRELIEFIRRVQWTAGISGIKNISKFHRSSLLIIFKVANYVKLIRMKTSSLRSRDLIRKSTIKSI